jgi:hypothetical protein
LDQLFTAADPNRPEVNPFNLAALGCKAFFDQHSSALEYFASVGCANWFGGSISSFQSIACGASSSWQSSSAKVAKGGCRRCSRTSLRTHFSF